MVQPFGYLWAHSPLVKSRDRFAAAWNCAHDHLISLYTLVNIQKRKRTSTTPSCKEILWHEVATKNTTIIMIYRLYICTYKTWFLSVCGFGFVCVIQSHQKTHQKAGYRIHFVHVFPSHQMSQHPEILTLSLIWANLKQNETRLYDF